MTIEEYDGPRRKLRELFELAEDSGQVLDAYIDEGRVLVAFEGDEAIGHLQLTDTDEPTTAEVKNMAVLASHQRRGVGATLMAAAIALAREQRRSTLIVATAAADIGNLRFYQRLGFRMRSVERDAFTAATGYADDIDIEGIPLRDRVWLDLEIDAPS
ncbi:MAG TPA: GNAT family N-acetyltransferase [Solirubrobacteraceae bacterium]|nr:GNAT family N-acetyltransferase [Solirubrobacteraceae bacterium]